MKLQAMIYGIDIINRKKTIYSLDGATKKKTKITGSIISESYIKTL